MAWSRRGRRLAATRAWARALVRSGLGDLAQARLQIAEVIAADHRGLDPQATSAAWVGQEAAAWAADARLWPERTDVDRLESALEELAERGVAALPGCADHWAARDWLQDHPGVRGIAWFTPPDVWHAIDEGMLEVNLWHASTANARPGDGLLEEVIDVLATAGLSARFDEGRIEVAARWQRRPGEPPLPAAL